MECLIGIKLSLALLTNTSILGLIVEQLRQTPIARTPISPAPKGQAMSALESECLQQLSYSEFGARQDNINQELEGTCNWVSQHPTYVQWLKKENVTSHAGLLWIKGKPGAGKSVIMKKLLRNIMYEQSPGMYIHVSFFITAHRYNT